MSNRTQIVVKSRAINRRHFVRVPFRAALRFLVCQEETQAVSYAGTIANISQTGLLFSAVCTPPISSIILCATDFDMIERCITLNDFLFFGSNLLMCKVVRVAPYLASNEKDVGLEFIRRGDEHRTDVQNAMEINTLLM